MKIQPIEKRYWYKVLCQTESDAIKLVRASKKGKYSLDKKSGRYIAKIYCNSRELMYNVRKIKGNYIVG